ncbi:ABC transporter substrate-binding protein [Gracilimonas sp.]|uniref:ABC transporter substrate-binding protein n=1 Tax=Gracilimonas sp. TaxID=1974203 RepID=UPI002870F86B|nr:ABC transporter substrate-binding protein [Gracilimonas sp.]
MKNVLLLLFSMVIMISCGKGPETVTVNADNSNLFSPTDSISAETETSEDEEFIHIKLGEIAKIESLDPLFATSNSEFRILNLVYDRLVKLHLDGNIGPALAKRWTVSNNSTQYTFHLRSDAFFHDSPVFEGNTGRKVVASDVKYIFERMAQANVPGFASRYFNDIRGFNAYQNENEYVKNPELRVINSIEGIRVRNDSTISFILKRPSGNFLTRLAHPRASVYPRENVPSSRATIQQAAGSGVFRFIQHENNSHLLTVNEDYFGQKPSINRLDVISGLSERDLFQEFASTNLHALIELSPSILTTVADSTGTLQSSIYKNYALQSPSVYSYYNLYYNRDSNQRQQAYHLLKSLNSDDLLSSPALGSISTYIPDSLTVNETDSVQLISTQTEHPFEMYLLNNLGPVANSLGYTFSMSPTYAINNITAFSTRPYSNARPILSWRAPLYILHHNSVSGIKIEAAPWNLDVSSIELNEVN